MKIRISVQFNAEDWLTALKSFFGRLIIVYFCLGCSDPVESASLNAHSLPSELKSFPPDHVIIMLAEGLSL